MGAGTLTLSLVSEQPDPLRALLQARLDELGISRREAGRRTEKVGYETISRILRGATRGDQLTDRTIEGLSEALQIPVRLVYEAAGRDQPVPWFWPDRFRGCTMRQRQIVEEVAAGFCEANEAARKP